MKLFLIFLLGCFLQLHCDAQNKAIEADSILRKLQQKLKTDWDLKIHNDTLIIESNNFIWIDFYQVTPSLPSSDTTYNKYTSEYVQKNGKKSKLTILLKTKPKWDSLKINKTKRNNEKIVEETNQLVKKYKLSDLKLTHHDKDGSLLQATKDENDRFRKYKVEKNRLSKKIIELPIYNSEKYSLFVISKTRETINLIQPVIYPISDRKKIDNLEVIINDILKNSR